MAELCVIPTFNEAETVVPVIRGVLEQAPLVDVLVVDDNSPDGTGAIVERLSATNRRVHVLRRPGKQGLGEAYRAGFGWGLQRNYDVFVEMDADLSHDPVELPSLLDAVADADIVIGSRYRRLGRTEGWPMSRRLISRVGNMYVRLVLGMPLTDATSGYRVFTREVLTELPVSELTSSGYCFQIETAYRSFRRGFRLSEVPITFRQRRAGCSKMSLGIVAEAVIQVARWRWQETGRPLLHRVPSQVGAENVPVGPIPYPSASPEGGSAGQRPEEDAPGGQCALVRSRRSPLGSATMKPR
jgi:glycosyltransferase involved in cell wall biosynthesis